MEDAFYWIVFSCFCMPVVALVWNQGVGSLVEDTIASRAFRNNYLLVYCFQMRELGGATEARGQGGHLALFACNLRTPRRTTPLSGSIQQLHTSSSHQQTTCPVLPPATDSVPVFLLSLLSGRRRCFCFRCSR